MKRTKQIVLISLFSCISVVFDIVKEFIPFINMPNGGSINISLIPIVCICFILDTKSGLICAIISFIISSIFGLNNIYISLPQYFFDYIIPSICVGLSGIFYKNKNLFNMELGIIVCMFVRFFSITISGAYFWLSDTIIAGSKEAFIGSFIYNFPYSIATLTMLLIIVPIIVRVLNKYLL